MVFLNQPLHTGVAQLVEHRSPKPSVGRSSRSSRAETYPHMKIVEYLSETYTELVHKVSWPTWKDLQSSALIAMIASLLIAMVVFLMDISFQNIMDFIYKLLY